MRQGEAGNWQPIACGPRPLHKLLCIIPIQRWQSLCCGAGLALCPVTSLSDGWDIFSEALKNQFIPFTSQGALRFQEKGGSGEKSVLLALDAEVYTS